ncbi:baseplate J/gp47 family protein, partial [Salmonella enterica]|uniref:baseplate J/gp47 family protein n=1 Tax=Salmonella enterica TaxID=28901 RepID=UPI0020C41CA2
TMKGRPGPVLFAKIDGVLRKYKKRPLTDKVSAKCSPRVDYQIRARLTLFTTADQETSLAAAREAIYTWSRSRLTRLGQDIVPI